jgi:hemolysin III
MNRFREPVSGFLHLFGAILALIGSLALITASGHSVGELISLLVYGLSLIVMFSASTVMHLYRGSARTLLWLNRIDHASIYVTIAGTYTPFCYHFLTGAWRWGMLILMWTLAAAGVIYKLLFLQGNGRGSITFYLAMGWSAVLGAPKFLPLLPAGAIVLMVAGGLIYTAGAFIFYFEKPNLHRYMNYHDLWHVFVLIGTLLFYIAVAHYAV